MIADTIPGLYDEHGRKLAAPRFAALFRSGRAIELAPGRPRVNDDADPSISLAADDIARFGAVLARVGISSGIRARDDRDTLPTAIAIHSYRNGNVNLLALQRDFLAATAEQISVQFPRRAYVYDVLAGSFLGHKRELRLTLDRVVPSILALSPLPLSRPSLTMPRSAHPGEKVRLVLGLTGPSQHAVHVLHLAVSDPIGRTISAFSSNVIMRHREVVIHLPLAARRRRHMDYRGGRCDERTACSGDARCGGSGVNAAFRTAISRGARMPGAGASLGASLIDRRRSRDARGNLLS